MTIDEFFQAGGPRRPDLALRLSFGAVVVFVAAAVVFSVFPSIDLSAAQSFYLGAGRFAGEAAFVKTARAGFNLVFTCVAVAAGLGLLLTAAVRKSWLGFDAVRWLYLAVCLMTGPGIVANLALKNEWGRARPNQIVEFGGVKTFTPALVPTDQCQKNCSFVSGEASAIFMLFFAGAFLFRRRATHMIAAGLVAGSAMGAVRMAQGGHFFSDVVFAGVAMALTAAAIYAMFATIGAAAQKALPQNPAQSLPP